MAVERTDVRQRFGDTFRSGRFPALSSGWRTGHSRTVVVRSSYGDLLGIGLRLAVVGGHSLRPTATSDDPHAVNVAPSNGLRPVPNSTAASGPTWKVFGWCSELGSSLDCLGQLVLHALSSLGGCHGAAVAEPRYEKDPAWFGVLGCLSGPGRQADHGSAVAKSEACRLRSAASDRLSRSSRAANSACRASMSAQGSESRATKRSPQVLGARSCGCRSRRHGGAFMHHRHLRVPLFFPYARPPGGVSLENFS